MWDRGGGRGSGGGGEEVKTKDTTTDKRNKERKGEEKKRGGVVSEPTRLHGLAAGMFLFAIQTERTQAALPAGSSQSLNK